MQHFQHRHIFDALEQQPTQDEVHQDDELPKNIKVFDEEITLLHRNDVDPNIIQANKVLIMALSVFRCTISTRIIQENSGSNTPMQSNNAPTSFPIASHSSLNENATDVISTKKGRGPTRGILLNKLNKAIGKKLSVEISLEHGYMKGLGYGPKSKKVVTPNSRMQELKDSLKESQADFNESRGLYIDLKAKVARQSALIESLIVAGLRPTTLTTCYGLNYLMCFANEYLIRAQVTFVVLLQVFIICLLFVGCKFMLIEFIIEMLNIAEYLITIMGLFA
ncbi:hypothetical protein GH714_032224 [Hevea brasiliensis]|uniref:Uncharacterized protein n=1 Tax=Hevea brasiliensis TaxID=3981 RepID=A0A6A6N4A3_HEVBR|nr:hypothetical protein GH714_032224 [Hevea brasiliensis]